MIGSVCSTFTSSPQGVPPPFVALDPEESGHPIGNALNAYDLFYNGIDHWLPVGAPPISNPDQKWIDYFYSLASNAAVPSSPIPSATLIYTVYNTYYEAAVNSARLMRQRRNILMQFAGGQPELDKNVLTAWFLLDVRLSVAQFVLDDLIECGHFLPNEPPLTLIRSFKWNFLVPKVNPTTGAQIFDRAGNPAVLTASVDPGLIHAFTPNQVDQAKFEMEFRQQQINDNNTLSDMLARNVPTVVIRDVSASLPTNPLARDYVQAELEKAIAGQFDYSFIRAVQDPSLPPSPDNTLSVSDRISLVAQAYETIAGANPVYYDPKNINDLKYALAVEQIDFWKTNGPSFNLNLSDNREVLKTAGYDPSQSNFGDVLYRPWHPDPQHPDLSPLIVVVSVMPQKLPPPKMDIWAGLVIAIVGVVISVASAGTLSPIAVALVAGAFAGIAAVVNYEDMKDYLGKFVQDIPVNAFMPSLSPQPFKVLLPLNWAQYAVQHQEFGVALVYKFATLIKEAEAIQLKNAISSIPDVTNPQYNLSNLQVSQLQQIANDPTYKSLLPDDTVKQLTNAITNAITKTPGGNGALGFVGSGTGQGTGEGARSGTGESQMKKSGQKQSGALVLAALAGIAILFSRKK